MVKYRTADMSHEQIRNTVQQALNTKYPAPQPDPVDYEAMPWAMEVYDGHVIHSGGPGKGLYKQKYKMGSDGACELMGDPEEVQMGYVTKASMQLQAAKVTTGDEADAQELMDDLIEKNPLMASIKDSPNTHLVIFDLTSIGKPSNHEGAFHYQLAKSGLKAALPTLISKPIHVTEGFDGHFTAGKDPIAIGVFLGGVVIDQPDGSQVLRAVGTLWDDDFPGIVDEIKEKRAQLGASYEIAYLAASASRLGGKVIEIGQYEFSGGALLYKSAAAHHETQLLMASKDTSTAFDVLDDEQFDRLAAYLRGGTSFTQADTLSYKAREDLSDSDFALVQTVDGRSVRRFPIHDEAHRKNAWARLSQAKGLSSDERATVANKIINKAKSVGDGWAADYKKSGGEWVKGKGDGKDPSAVLNKAIVLHEKHMDNPSTATATSQEDLMEMLKQAKKLVAGDSHLEQGTQTKGGASMKYQGIPQELEAVVDALLADATTKMTADATARIAVVEAKLKAAMDPKEPDADDEKPAFLKKKQAELEAKVAELSAEIDRLKTFEAKSTELTAAGEVLKEQLATATIALDEIAAEKTMTDTVAALKADYGLTDAQLKEEKRAPLVAKQAAGKVPLTIAEWKTLMTGAQVPGVRGEKIPLFAGGGDPDQVVPDKDAIARNFPNAVVKKFR